MAYLSDYLGGGASLTGLAGAEAINANDLLELTQDGSLIPVKISDYAAIANAGQLVAPTTVQAYSLSGSVKKEAFACSDGTFIFVTPSSTSNTVPIVSKYSASGALLASYTLDTTNSPVYAPCIQQLSNGNLVVAWLLLATGPNTVRFAVLSPNLAVIVAPVTVTTVADAYSYSLDMISLAAGGFALSYCMPTGVFLAIYGNNGAVVSAGTLVSGSPAAGSSTAKLAVQTAQLSNGNIAIAINSQHAGYALGHAIYTNAGAMVLAYTVLDSATSAGGQLPKISALPGYYCCGILDGTNAFAVVLNNAGVIQGAPFTVPDTNVDSVNTQAGKLLNNGTNFWYILGTMIIFIPVAGAGFITNTLTVSPGADFDAFIESSEIVVGIPSNVYVFKTTSQGAVSLSASIADTVIAWVKMVSFGDKAFAKCSVDTNCIFTIKKYENTAIVGISQTTVAANNAGTVVNYSMGTGGYSCNAIGGTVGKGFDHSASNIIGNKGTILGNSVALAGIV